MKTLTPKFLSFALTLLAVSAFSLSASARGGDGERGGKRGFGKRGGPKLARIIKKNAAELGIDDATVQAASEIATSARAERQAMRAQMKPLREELRAQLDSDTPDEGAVMEIVGQLSELKGQAAIAKTQTMLQFRALLTAEQWSSIKAMKKARRGKRGKFGKRGKRGDRGGDAIE